MRHSDAGRAACQKISGFAAVFFLARCSQGEPDNKNRSCRVIPLQESRQRKPKPRARSLSARAERLLISGGFLVFLLALWEGSVRAGLVNPLFTSSPSLILRAAWRLFAEGAIWNDLRVSAIEFAVGYLLAAAVAIPLGLAAGWYKRLLYVIGPFVDALNAMPRITLIPIIIIWFGIGIWSKVVVVFLGAVIPDPD